MPVRPIIAPEFFTDLTFPVAGLDESFGFERQRKDTTASCQNVRAFDPVTDRARGGQRPGLAKYLAAQVNGSASIQDLDRIVVPFDMPQDGPGQFTYDGNPGVGIASITGTSFYRSAADTLHCTFWDSGYLYVARRTSGFSIYVTKHDTYGTVQWTTTIGGFSACDGLATDGTYLYVAIGNTIVPTARIFRLLLTDGTMVGGTHWIDNSTVLTGALPTPDPGVGGTLRQNCLSCIASAARLGVNGFVNATSSRFDVINTATGTLVGTNVIATAGATGAAAYDTDNDGTSFYYVAATKYVVKLTTAAAETWRQTDATTGPRSICYESVSARVACCGSGGSLLGAGKSFATVAPTTGVFSFQSTPGGFTDWTTVRPSSNGGFVLWRVATSANVMGITTPLQTAWGPFTLGHWNVAGSVNLVGAAFPDRVSSGRRVWGLAVAGGTIKRFNSTVGLVSISGGSAALATIAKVVFGTQSGARFYYVDGRLYLQYDAQTDTVSPWTATAGALPLDDVGYAARLICTWRGRVVLAGFYYKPQLWHMSAVGDAANWDVAPVQATPTQAVSGNSAPAGLVGDTVNGLIPYSDDLLIILGDHTVWIMAGDPMAGGQLDLVTDTIGGAWGRAFCKGPDGTVYFFATRGGVFAMVPGAKPVRVSQQISDRLADVDLNATIVRMAWDDRLQGFHLFLTPTDSAVAATHYTWEARTNAFNPVVYANKNHNPKTVHVFDGDSPSDRTVLFGSWDGYIRNYSNTATKDDGSTIVSNVLLGPYLSPDLTEPILKDLQAIMGETSGDVTYAVLVGRTAEEAQASAPVLSGTWKAGRNPVSAIRRASHAIYVKISATTPWAMELVQARLAGTGKVRKRSPY